MKTDLYSEALDTFAQLFQQAVAAGEPEPTAMTVASVDAQGRPSARTVLLKSHDAHGFVFYTHLDGRKGRQLQANPQAALLFYWPRINEGVQVRIEGAVTVVDAAQADAYFASRPRQSQLGAWASIQSQTLASRADFDARYAQAEARFAGVDVPRPPRWGGFCVKPAAIEFWYGAQYRLHERWLYETNAQGQWQKRMLYP